MGKRLLVGIPLAAAIIAVFILDAWLSGQTPPAWLLPDTRINAAAWLWNGAIVSIVVLVLTVLATHELVLLARARGYRPFGRTAQVFAAFLVLAPYVSFNLRDVVGGYDESWSLLWLAMALACGFLIQAVVHKTAHAMENIAITVFIIFYAGGLAGFLTKLRMEVGGSAGVVALLFSVFLVKITDVGAYFSGRLLGRTKMVPWLSPKKTWEGFAGGMVFSVGCALGLGLWLNYAGLLSFRSEFMGAPATLLLLGLLLGLFSTAGDLCASLLKRDAAVKDSGQAFPGLGGVLDVMDSPLLAAPVAWVFWTRLFHVLP